MEAAEKEIAYGAALFAIVGIVALLFMSETPRDASVAEAAVALPNSLLRLQGTAANVTADKFQLCQSSVCVPVKKMGLAPAELVSPGCSVTVLGRVKEYRGNRYFEAEAIEVK